jgi:hypothetical protein
MLRLRYNLKALLMVTTIVASFLAGSQTRRFNDASEERLALSRARSAANAALRDKAISDLWLEATQLQLELSCNEVRLRSMRGG